MDSVRRKTMDFVAVLVLACLATTQAASFQYDPRGYMPALALAASGMDFQQLQYCFLDNCTIVKIDSGQQLDIVYTTQSCFVVIPTDGQTSLLVPKNKPEQFCPPNFTGIPTATLYALLAIGITSQILTALVSGCTVAMLLLLKSKVLLLESY